MAAKKVSKAPPKNVICRAGTPLELETDRRTTTNAKAWLSTRLTRYKKWGDKFNHSLAEQLQSIALEIDGLDLQTLKSGKVLHWEAKDDYSGVRFVFEIEGAR